jgi:hypothetical protein
MNIKRISDGEVFEVRKYIKGNGEESVWCDHWYGHHVVGVDCELVKTYTAEDMDSFAEWTCIDGWCYLQGAKLWVSAKNEEKTTAQLRELWEQERVEK